MSVSNTPEIPTSRFIGIFERISNRSISFYLVQYGARAVQPSPREVDGKSSISSSASDAKAIMGPFTNDFDSDAVTVADSLDGSTSPTPSSIAATLHEGSPSVASIKLSEEDIPLRKYTTEVLAKAKAASLLFGESQMSSAFVPSALDTIVDPRGAASRAYPLPIGTPRHTSYHHYHSPYGRADWFYYPKGKFSPFEPAEGEYGPDSELGSHAGSTAESVPEDA
ncbi:hypothetical protein DL93DRAFT_2151372 [Clavulina sp. PMI_390]|nr:hypothetical protein DL93DRAFT_2151372 [Clavulina sp. PMI_390]